MPTKKKKQTSSRLGRGDGSWLSNAFDQGMLLHFYRDRGMGLQPFIEEGIRPFNKIKSFKHLETFLKKIRMDPATAHEILDKFLFHDKHGRMNFLKHYVSKDIRTNRREIDRLLAAIKKYSVEIVFKGQDPDGELAAFERCTLYKRPKKIKSFQKDLTILREAVGKKRSRDGSYSRKQLEIYKKRALRKLLRK